MAKVFHSDGSGNARPSDPSIVPGWYYWLDMRDPVGPYETKKAAEAALQGAARCGESDRPKPSGCFGFRVPVYVEIEDGRVTSVRVMDETAPDLDNSWQVDGDSLENLLGAANADEDWPSWRFGF